MRCGFALALTSFTILTVAACGESEAELDAQRAQASADSVALAEGMYDDAVFDTIAWESDEARRDRGDVVYRSSCVKCHGTNGGGNGEIAMQFELAVPSFMDPEWRYAGDTEALRRAVFVGHEGSMPNWGLHGLRYKDIDAVAAYISEAMSAVETTEAAE